MSVPVFSTRRSRARYRNATDLEPLVERRIVNRRTGVAVEFHEGHLNTCVAARVAKGEGAKALAGLESSLAHAFQQPRKASARSAALVQAWPRPNRRPL